MAGQGEIEKLKQRIADLEQAIIDANSWVECGEGVELIYYHNDYGDDKSEAIIASLVRRTN